MKAATKSKHNYWMVKQEPETYSWDDLVKGAYPDPTADDPQWVAVDLKPVKPLTTAVQLAAIRYDKRLSQLPLIRQSQLSVMPLTKDEFDVIVSMGTSKTRRRQQ